MDRLLVCYFYREPPCYDDAMTQLSIKLMKYIGLISLLGSWYQLSSHKIFETDPRTIHKNAAGQSPKQEAAPIEDDDGLKMTFQDGPLILFIFVFSYFAFYWIRKYVLRIDDSSEDKYAKMQLIEGLADYWAALKPDKDKPVMIGRELYFIDKYRMPTYMKD
jgi:hypothetical protein